MEMYADERVLTIDGKRFTSIGHAGAVETETWSEFRVYVDESGHAYYTGIDTGVVGQFDRPFAGQLLEVLTAEQVNDRLEDYLREHPSVDPAQVRAMYATLPRPLRPKIRATP